MLVFDRDELNYMCRYLANELGLLVKEYPETKIKDIDICKLVKTFEVLMIYGIDPDNVHSYDYRDKKEDDRLLLTSLTKLGKPVYLKEFRDD